jgi:hypothetical protein
MSLSKSSTNGIGNKSDVLTASQIWDDIQSQEFESLAVSWFGDLYPVELSKALLENTESLESLKIIRHWLKDHFEPIEKTVITGFATSPESFGRAVNIEKSGLGAILIQTLESERYEWTWGAGISDYLDVSPQADITFDQKDSIRLSVPIEDGKLILKIEVRKLKTGEENLIFSAPVLVSSRPINLVSKWYVDNSESGLLEFDEVPFKDLRKALNIGDWPQKIVHPILLKKLFFIAESGITKHHERTDPSVAQKREILPTPLMFTSQNMHVERGYVGQDGVEYVCALKYPSITSMGWVVRNSELINLKSHLKRFTNGLAVVDQLLLHASRRNSNSKIIANDWAKATLPSTMMLGLSQCKLVNGAGRWYAVGAALDQLFRTHDTARLLQEGNLSESERRLKIEEQVEYGVGISYASCVNTYVFSYLLDGAEFELATRILGYAIQMKVPRESLTARSNLGIVHFIQGRFDEAEQEFLATIEESQLPHLGQFNPDEPYRYLAEIAKIRGDRGLEQSYLEKCNDLGGYKERVFEVLNLTENVDEIDLASDQSLLEIGLPKSSQGLGEEVQKLGNFCITCGSKFAGISDKFCGQCGERRK